MKKVKMILCQKKNKTKKYLRPEFGQPLPINIWYQKLPRHVLSMSYWYIGSIPMQQHHIPSESLCPVFFFFSPDASLMKIMKNAYFI